MDTIAAAFTVLAILAGLFFFLAGSVGVLRMPDTLSRIHPLAKADNLALGFIAIGLLPQAGSLLAGAKIIAIWALMQVGSGAVAQLMGMVARDEEKAHGTGRSPGDAGGSTVP